MISMEDNISSVTCDADVSLSSEVDELSGLNRSNSNINRWLHHSFGMNKEDLSNNSIIDDQGIELLTNNNIHNNNRADSGIGLIHQVGTNMRNRRGGRPPLTRDRSQQQGLPRSAFFIIGSEFCERFTYYGIKCRNIYVYIYILILYINQIIYILM